MLSNVSAQCFDNSFDILRGSLSGLQDERGRSPEIERSQRLEQVFTMQRLLVIGQGEIIDGLDP